MGRLLSRLGNRAGVSFPRAPQWRDASYCLFHYLNLEFAHGHANH